jgi:hypothetical protein
VKENHKSLHQEEAVVVVQAIFDDVFEEVKDRYGEPERGE